MVTEYRSCTRADEGESLRQQLLRRNNTPSSWQHPITAAAHAQIKAKVSDISCCAATTLTAADCTQSLQLHTRRQRQKTPTAAAAPQHSQQLTAPNHCSCSRADKGKRLRQQLLRRNNTPSSCQHPITAAAHAQTKAKDSDISSCCAATTLTSANGDRIPQLHTQTEAKDSDSSCCVATTLPAADSTNHSRQRKNYPAAAAPQQH
jgi:uncharacterized protein YsxB (DUF464 family)